MIVKKLEEVVGTDRQIDTENWTSYRLLLKREGMGFSLHVTDIHAGTSTRMCYENHLEAVYCMEGRGSVTLVETDETFPIEPGTVYALDQHDKHVLRADTRLRMLCVFNPPVVGREVHDANGAYPKLLEADA